MQSEIPGRVRLFYGIDFILINSIIAALNESGISDLSKFKSALISAVVDAPSFSVFS